jgi:hypothetical protein
MEQWPWLYRARLVRIPANDETEPVQILLIKHLDAKSGWGRKGLAGRWSVYFQVYSCILSNYSQAAEGLEGGHTYGWW